MKTWMLAAVSLFALGAVAPATAADLPIYKAPAAAVPVYDWSGIYAGINGGGGLAHACWGVTRALGIAVDPAVGEGCHNAGGGTVGGQLGYRWQKSRWVFGIEGQGNWANSTFEDLVQYNDGFRTGLIGTPLQIAERIVAFKQAGVDLILSAFLHFQEEVAYFGSHVMPLVRELEAKRAQEAA